MGICSRRGWCRLLDALDRIDLKNLGQTAGVETGAAGPGNRDGRGRSVIIVYFVLELDLLSPDPHDVAVSEDLSLDWLFVDEYPVRTTKIKDHVAPVRAHDEGMLAREFLVIKVKFANFGVAAEEHRAVSQPVPLAALIPDDERFGQDSSTLQQHEDCPGETGPVTRSTPDAMSDHPGTTNTSGSRRIACFHIIPLRSQLRTPSPQSE